MAKNKKVKTSKKAKNKTNIIKKKTIRTIIVLLIISALMYMTYSIINLIITPTDTLIIENGTVAVQESAVGYIIRDETIVKGSNYENGMLQIKTEGEKVAVGENVFRYYSNNEEILNKKIQELNTQIQEAMEGQTEIFSSDIKSLDTQIENKIEGLKYKNSIQGIIEYKNDIDTYLTKKSKIAGQLSASGTYINELLSQKQQYENELAANSEYVKASRSGVVSYRIDNLEEVLTPNGFENLNKDVLDRLNIKTGQIISTSTQMSKIVNNYETYIATILKSDEAKQAEVNKKVKLKMSTQNEISAQIVYTKQQEDNNILIVLKITNSVEKLIDYRKISFDIIWWSVDGLRVPNSAILYDQGLSYVIRKRAGYSDKILVEILNQNDKYCIVDSYSNKDLTELGYTDSQISSMKKITIYDEILTNPRLEDTQ